MRGDPQCAKSFHLDKTGFDEKGADHGTPQGPQGPEVSRRFVRSDLFLNQRGKEIEMADHPEARKGRKKRR